NEGTWVVENHPEGGTMEQAIISGVAHDKSEAKITIVGVPDRTGIAARIFQSIADNDINIDMIVQNVSSAGSTDISFTLSKDELPKAKAALETAVREIGAQSVAATDGIAKLSVVGIGMRSHSGVAAKLFEALSTGGINIQMISTSEIKTAVIIEEGKINEAAKLAHTAFGLDAQPAA
ncbi:MAG: Aspartokinase, partial [Verrucomicrobiota bacterium]